jgi:hypothetical protein
MATGHAAAVVTVLLVTLYSNCGTAPVDVVFYRSDDHRFTRAERRLIEDVAEQAAADARALLPDLPPFLIVRVQAGSEVLETTGDRAARATPNVVYWTVDPERPGGVIAIARDSLRRSLFHHLYGLARASAMPEPRSALADNVAFGLETIFARDFSGDPVPWATYPPEARDWVDEVAAVPAGVDYQERRIQVDGESRRLAPLVGMYLADEAVRRSGRSAAALVGAPAAAILEMATAGALN